MFLLLERHDEINGTSPMYVLRSVSLNFHLFGERISFFCSPMKLESFMTEGRVESVTAG